MGTYLTLGQCFHIPVVDHFDVKTMQRIPFSRKIFLHDTLTKRDLPFMYEQILAVTGHHLKAYFYSDKFPDTACQIVVCDNNINHWLIYRRYMNRFIYAINGEYIDFLDASHPDLLFNFVEYIDYKHGN